MAGQRVREVVGRVMSWSTRSEGAVVLPTRESDDGQGHWVTLHNSGTHVYIQNGRVTKGPPTMAGRAADEALAGQSVTHHPPGHDPQAAAAAPGSIAQQLWAVARDYARSRPADQAAIDAYSDLAAQGHLDQGLLYTALDELMEHVAAHDALPETAPDVGNAQHALTPQVDGAVASQSRLVYHQQMRIHDTGEEEEQTDYGLVIHGAYGKSSAEAAAAAKADVMVQLGAHLEQQGVTAQQAHAFSTRIRAQIASDDPLMAGWGMSARGTTTHQQAADAVLASWANTSTGGPAALALQALAAQEFGLAPFAPHAGYESPQHWETAQHLLADPEVAHVGRTLLRGMHDETQRRLAQAGVTHLVLTRGVMGTANAAIVYDCTEAEAVAGWDQAGVQRSWQAQGTAALQLNPLSSFALDAQDAVAFAGSSLDARDPALHFVGTVPAARVLSLWTTGVGCRNESEAVVLGGGGQMQWLAGGGGDPSDADTAAQSTHALGLQLRRMASGSGGVREAAQQREAPLALDARPHNADWPKINQARKAAASPEARAGARLLGRRDASQVTDLASPDKGDGPSQQEPQAREAGTVVPTQSAPWVTIKQGGMVHEDAQIEDQPNRDYGDPPLLRSQLPNPDEPEVSDTGGDEDDEQPEDQESEGSVQEAADDGDGHWITLKKGPLSTHVFVNAHGVITKGPASLIQHGLRHLPPPPELNQEHHAPGQMPAGATEHHAYTDRGAALAGEFIAWQGQSALPAHLAQALQPAQPAALPPGQSTQKGRRTQAPAAARPAAPSVELPALGSSPLGDVQAPTDPAVWPASHTFFKAEEQRYGTAEHAWYATRQSVGAMLAQAGVSAQQAQHLNQYLHAASELYPRGEPTPHEELADRCMTGWAASGAADPVYQVLQSLAAQEFGLGPYDERHTYVKYPSVWDAVQRVLDDPEAVRTGRSVLRAIYDHTQAHLQAHGLEHVALFRGVQNVTTPSVVTAVQQARHAAGAAQSAYQYDESWMADGTAQTHLWPLSSFTFDPNIGQEYSGSELGYKNRSRDSADAVLAAQVPRQRVLSLWTTGLGNGGEAEAVVLGGPAQVRWVAGQEGRSKEMRDALRAAAQGAPIREAAQDERDNVIDVDGTPENAEWLRRLSTQRQGPPDSGEDHTAGQPTDQPVQEADDDGADGHWVTLKSLGLTSHVFVNPHGVITKGPAQLTGHAVGHLPPAPHVEQEHHAGGEEPQGARDQANYSAENVGGATQPWKGAALAGAHLALAGAHNATAVAQREQEAKKEAQGGYWGSFHLRNDRHDQVGVFLNKKGTITKGPESLVGANMFELENQDRLAGHPGAALSNEEEPEQPRGMTEHPTYVDKHDEIGQGAATKSPAEGLLGLERAFYEHQRGQGALQGSPLHDRQNFERRLGQVYGLDTTDEAAQAGARTPVDAATTSALAHRTQDVDAAEQARHEGHGDPVVATKIAVMKDIGTRLGAMLPADDARWAIRALRGQDPDDFTWEHAKHPQRYHFGMARALTEMWALSSSDTHAAPLATQLIAAQHFGITSWDQHDADHPPPTCADPKEWAAARALAQDPRYQRCVKAYVGAMYQNTQERLRAHGVTHLALCRGTQDYAPGHLLSQSIDAANAQIDHVQARGSQDHGEASQWVAGGTVETTLNPLSSFAMNAEVAASGDFGGATSLAQLQEGKANIHYVGAVPAARVLSLYSTGLGCRNEHEAVVLGGQAQMQWVAAGTHGLARSWLERLQHGGRQPGVQPTVAGQAHNPHPEVQQQIDRLDSHGVKVTDNMPDHYTPVQKAQALHNVANAVDLMHQHFPQLAQANQRHGMEYSFDGPQRTQNADGSYDVTMGAYDDSSAQPTIHINEGAEQTLWHEAGHYLDHALKGRTQDRTPGAVNFASEAPDHHFNALAEHLKTTDAHQDMLRNDPAIQRHLGGHGDQEDADRHAYRTDNREVLARFFNGYMHHQAQKAGLPINEAPSRGDEQYSPEELEHYGSYLRDNLPPAVREALDDMLSQPAQQQTEPVNLDATIQNADWLKRTWDLQGEAKDQLQTIVGNAATLGERRQRVRQFLQTPAAFAMPPTLRKLLAARGYLPREAREADDTQGHWVTWRGVHVFIDNGRVTKGPRGLLGAHQDNLPRRAVTWEPGQEPDDAHTHPDYAAHDGHSALPTLDPEETLIGFAEANKALFGGAPTPSKPSPAAVYRALFQSVPPQAVTAQAGSTPLTPAGAVPVGRQALEDVFTVAQEHESDVYHALTEPVAGAMAARGLTPQQAQEALGAMIPVQRGAAPTEHSMAACAHTFMDQWAGASGSRGPVSLALWHAAAGTFGVPGVAQRPDYIQPAVWDRAQALQKDPSWNAAAQAFLGAQYDYTQKLLGDLGLDHVTLHRGTAGVSTPAMRQQAAEVQRQARSRPWVTQGEEDTSSNPLASYALTPQDTAPFFDGATARAEGGGAIWSVTVPRQRIVGFAMTGLGAAAVHEFVVVGGAHDRAQWTMGNSAKSVVQALEGDANDAAS